MTEIIDPVISISLVIMVIMLLPCAYRVWKGPSPEDRLQASDLMTSILVGVIVLLALVERDHLVIDLAIALATFSFIGTLAIARYISEGRVF